MSEKYDVDVLVNVREPLADHVGWLWGRRQGDRHRLLLHCVQGPGGSKGDREAKLRELHARSTAPYVILADDDDYVPPWFVETLFSLIEADPTIEWSAFIPERYYLLGARPAWGESRKRTRPFQTFAIYDREALGEMLAGRTPWPSEQEFDAPYHRGLIVMRGPGGADAITSRKSSYSETHWPNLDTTHDKLREWLKGPDPDAYYRYLELSEELGRGSSRPSPS